jgi:hypothetical protein
LTRILFDIGFKGHHKIGFWNKRVQFVATQYEQKWKV